MMKSISDIDTSTKEGKMLMAVLGDVTSRPKFVNANGVERPSGSWTPDDSIVHYAKHAEEIFA
jgi:hypothetical protein